MYLCIDIGGTKTLLALLDHSGKLLHSVKFPTIDDQTKFYAVLSRQIRINFVLSKLSAIAVAMPGLVRHNRAIWLGNLNWRDFDLAKLLTKDFQLPVYLENDANLAALAEARRCSGRSLYLTFSTGIGGGIIDNSQLVQRFLDFEPGHTRYVYQDKATEWEDLAAASAIYRHFGKYVESIEATSDWKNITERILIGLTPLITSLKPDRVIFGGPLGLALNHYRNYLRTGLQRSLPPNCKIPRLLQAKYAHLSVIYGCYYYAKAQSSHR